MGSFKDFIVLTKVWLTGFLCEKFESSVEMCQPL